METDLQPCTIGGAYAWTIIILFGMNFVSFGLGLFHSWWMKKIREWNDRYLSG